MRQAPGSPQEVKPAPLACRPHGLPWAEVGLGGPSSVT